MASFSSVLLNVIPRRKTKSDTKGKHGNSTSGLCPEEDLIGLYGLAADEEVKKHFLFHMHTLFRFLVRNILERR